MLYFTDIGGTGFVAHRETGGMFAPESKEYVDVFSRDSAIHDAWRLIHFVEAKPNRMLIFQSGLMHVALPLGGSDGRIVLTAFYD